MEEIVVQSTIDIGLAQTINTTTRALTVGDTYLRGVFVHEIGRIGIYVGTSADSIMPLENRSRRSLVQGVEKEDENN